VWQVEEMKDASKQAPVSLAVSSDMDLALIVRCQRVMVWSMIFCSITSWLAALLMMWTAGNWESYMTGLSDF
jgi:choline transport protein